MSNYQVIPTFPDPFYTQVVQLEGSQFIFSWQYCQREDCYYLSIATPDAQDIVNGIKVVADWPLLHSCADNRLPPGELICKTNTPSTTPVIPGTAPGINTIIRGVPGLGQIGSSLPYTLYYIPSDQMP